MLCQHLRRSAIEPSELLLLLLLIGLVATLVIGGLLSGLLLFGIFGDLDLLEGRLGVDAQLLGHEAVDAVHERRWVRDVEARLDERSLEEHLCGVVRRLVFLVALDLRQEVDYDGVVGVDLQSLPARHHRELVLVLESLRLHHLLLLGRVAELGGHDDHRRVREPLGDLDLLNLHARILHSTLLGELGERLLPPVREGLVHVLHLGEPLLLRLRLVQLHVGLLDRDKLLPLVVRELLQARLIEMIREHEHLDVLLLEDLQRGRLLHSVDGVAGHVVDALLALLHAVQILVEAHFLVLSLGCEKAEELRELGAVGVVLVATHLKVLVEFLPELAPSRLIVLLVLLLLRLRFLLLLLTILLLLVVVIAGILLFRQLLHKLENLAHKLLRDNLHNLVLLKLLAGYI
mmetsp:Transcript_49154/g.111969  ORF Transcript_49154/g.111969 Transcript_49154/m.111969 type:complete len:403 (-) Transcript_49154:794-2002(-)